MPQPAGRCSSDEAGQAPRKPGRVVRAHDPERNERRRHRPAGTRPGDGQPRSPRPRVSQSHRQSRHRCRCRHGSAWPDREAGHHRAQAPAVAPSRHSASPRLCCRRQSAGSRPLSGRSCRHAPQWPDRSGWHGEHVGVEGCLRHPIRSNGCNQPYRHRPQRSASADLVA